MEGFFVLRFYQAAGAKALAVALAEARQDLIEGLQGFDPRYPQYTSPQLLVRWQILFNAGPTSCDVGSQLEFHG